MEIEFSELSILNLRDFHNQSPMRLGILKIIPKTVLTIQYLYHTIISRSDSNGE